jgi:hypothetical protein
MPRTFPEPDCRHASPSVDGKDTFIARMRFHQSWYRHHVLGLEPGPNPHARGEVYGNMLREEDGAAGRNFLSADIFAHAQERFPATLGRKEIGRLYDNLLGSQTMCFNLFGPLRSAPFELAGPLLKRLPDVPQDLTVTSVQFEHAPEKAKHLNDATSFDAFVEYTRPGGGIGFVGIETKLTEPFSRKHYDFAPRYARWQANPHWWWMPGAESAFSDVSFNQLWRNHLLAFAMLHQDTSTYSEGFCAVVYPRGDTSCVEALAVYRQHLLPGGKATLFEWPLEMVCDLWQAIVPASQPPEWLKGFRVRYLDLSASEEAWSAFRGRRARRVSTRRLQGVHRNKIEIS